MDNNDRKKAVEELKEICQEIGCSGLDPDICQKRPYRCDIIRKLCMPANKRVNLSANIRAKLP